MNNKHILAALLICFCSRFSGASTSPHPARPVPSISQFAASIRQSIRDKDIPAMNNVLLDLGRIDLNDAKGTGSYQELQQALQAAAADFFGHRARLLEQRVREIESEKIQADNSTDRGAVSLIYQILSHPLVQPALGEKYRRNIKQVQTKFSDQREELAVSLFHTVAQQWVTGRAQPIDLRAIGAGNTPTRVSSIQRDEALPGRPTIEMDEIEFNLLVQMAGGKKSRWGHELSRSIDVYRAAVDAAMGKKEFAFAPSADALKLIQTFPKSKVDILPFPKEWGSIQTLETAGRGTFNRRVPSFTEDTISNWEKLKQLSGERSSSKMARIILDFCRVFINHQLKGNAILIIDPEVDLSQYSVTIFQDLILFTMTNRMPKEKLPLEQ